MSATWIAADWPAADSVVAGTTLRGGGVSRGAYASLNLAAHVGDDPAAVFENRRRFGTACGLPGEPVWLRQVHGTRVVDGGAARSDPQADGVITRDAGVVCAVLTADCLPVLLTSPDGAEVAAVHAGWRGLSAGILEAAVKRFRAPAASLLAWLGPAISKAAFEVGPEVRRRFLGQNAAAAECFSENANGRFQADLYGLAALGLKSLGVTEIYGGRHCTHAEPDRFFSYRRDGRCGRMASFIYRRDGV